MGDSWAARWLAVVLAVLVISATGVRAKRRVGQTEHITFAADLKPLRDIAAAELEGTAYPRGDASEDQFPGGTGRTGEVGTVDRKCVDVGENVSARSGDFVAGPFGHVRGGGFTVSWQKGYTKVWWLPRYFPPMAQVPSDFDFGDAGLLVRSTKLDGSSDTAMYRWGGLGKNNGYFFNSTFWLPSAGRWLVVATFEKNWGCFLVSTR
jgi:hypothetical protein